MNESIQHWGTRIIKELEADGSHFFFIIIKKTLERTQ